MKLKIELANIFWWFWASTMVFIVSALAGWVPGYYVVIAISAIQVVLFLDREKDLLAFPVQIRIVYLIWTLTGLWSAIRFHLYILLLLGTIMVVFFDRCSITMLLKNMPWNRNRVPRIG